MADLKKLAEDLTKLTVLEVNELKTILKADGASSMSNPAKEEIPSLNFIFKIFVLELYIYF